MCLVLAATGFARGQSTSDRFLTVTEDGKPGERCKLLKTWREADGNKAYLVQSVQTGEFLSIVEKTSTSSAKTISTRIYHWGRSPTAPKGVPAPPPNATVVGTSSIVKPASPSTTSSASKPVVVKQNPPTLSSTGAAPTQPRLLEQKPVAKNVGPATSTCTGSATASSPRPVDQKPDLAKPSSSPYVGSASPSSPSPVDHRSMAKNVEPSTSPYTGSAAPSSPRPVDQKSDLSKPSSSPYLGSAAPSSPRSLEQKPVAKNVEPSASPYTGSAAPASAYPLDQKPVEKSTTPSPYAVLNTEAHTGTTTVGSNRQTGPSKSDSGTILLVQNVTSSPYGVQGTQAPQIPPLMPVTPVSPTTTTTNPTDSSARKPDDRTTPPLDDKPAHQPVRIHVWPWWKTADKPKDASTTATAQSGQNTTTTTSSTASKDTQNAKPAASVTVTTTPAQKSDAGAVKSTPSQPADWRESWGKVETNSAPDYKVLPPPPTVALPHAQETKIDPLQDVTTYSKNQGLETVTTVVPTPPTTAQLAGASSAESKPGVKTNIAKPEKKDPPPSTTAPSPPVVPDVPSTSQKSSRVNVPAPVPSPTLAQSPPVVVPPLSPANVPVVATLPTQSASAKADVAQVSFANGDSVTPPPSNTPPPGPKPAPAPAEKKPFGWRLTSLFGGPVKEIPIVDAKSLPPQDGTVQTASARVAPVAQPAIQPVQSVSQPVMQPTGQAAIPGVPLGQGSVVAAGFAAKEVSMQAADDAGQAPPRGAMYLPAPTHAADGSKIEWTMGPRPAVVPERWASRFRPKEQPGNEEAANAFTEGPPPPEAGGPPEVGNAFPMPPNQGGMPYAMGPRYPMAGGNPMPHPMPRVDVGINPALDNAFTVGGTTRPIPADFGPSWYPPNAFQNPQFAYIAYQQPPMPPMPHGGAPMPGCGVPMMAQAPPIPQQAPMMAAYPPMPGYYPAPMPINPAMAVPTPPPQQTAFGTPETATPPQLLAIVRDSLYPSQREYAIERLSLMDWRSMPDIIDGLVKAAKEDPAATVRACSVRCLVKMKPDRADVVEAIASLRMDKDDRVRKEVADALLVLTPTPPSGIRQVSGTAAPH
jgi:hypothetical protein